MHTVTVQINLFLFATAVLASLSPTSRLYTFPISTASLVGWSMVLGTIVVMVKMVVTIPILNVCFGLDWRPVGPCPLRGSDVCRNARRLVAGREVGLAPGRVRGRDDPVVPLV